MTTKQIPIGSFILSYRGTDIGQFTGINLGDGLEMSDQGPVVEIRASSTALVRSQETWYIDPVNGSNTNSGLTAQTALATFAEMLRRWGPSPLLFAPNTGFVTIHILGNLPVTDPIDFLGVTLGQDTNVLVKGQLTTVRSGTFTAVTPADPATNQAEEVDDTGRDWTPDIGSCLRVTAGPRLNTRAWVAKSLGGILARTSFPSIAAEPTRVGYTGVTPSSFQAGDTYNVEARTEVYCGALTECTRREVYTVHPGRFFFQDLKFVTFGEVSMIRASNFLFLNCWMAGYHIEQSASINFENCYVGEDGGFQSYTGTFFIDAGCINLANLDQFSRLVLTSDVLMQGTATGGFYAENGSIIEAEALAIFDCPGDAIALGFASTAAYPAGILTIGARLWGSGNVGVGVNMAAYGKGTYTTVVPTLTGTGGDFTMGGLGTARPWNEAGGVYGAAVPTSWASLSAAGNLHNVAAQASFLLG